MGPEAYGLLALVLFAEACGIPSPDELALFLAGIAVGRGGLSWPDAVLSSAFGAVVGAMLSYTLARRLGRPLILHHGRRVGLTETRLAAVETYVARWGMGAAVLGRVVSGVRLVIGYAAGLFGMAPAPFVLASGVGALVWSMLDVTAGMLLGAHARAIGGFAASHVWLALPLLVVLVAAYALWHFRKPLLRRP